MPPPASFEDLVAEGAAVATEGWDFSWLEGRATEERPTWGYSRMLVDRLSTAGAALDVQTGGGEVFAEALSRASDRPRRVVATEGWAPNAAVARRNLRRCAGSVVISPDHAPLPLADGAFDLVSSRHPVSVVWGEMARVLARGGTYFSQQVGAGSNRELTDFMMGPQPVGDARRPEVAVRGAASAGLVVVDLRHQTLRAEFHDVGAVTYFLRKVLWTVPGFTVEGYRHRLAALHEEIQRHGPFVTHVHRFLIEARRPDG
jgi:SAM-dependent methyltransferase